MPPRRTRGRSRRAAMRAAAPRRPSAPRGPRSRNRLPHAQPDELEEAARSMRVRVLVERPLPRAGAELLRGAGIAEQLAVRSGRTVRVLDHDQLTAQIGRA